MGDRIETGQGTLTLADLAQKISQAAEKFPGTTPPPPKKPAEAFDSSSTTAALPPEETPRGLNDALRSLILLIRAMSHNSAGQEDDQSYGDLLNKLGSDLYAQQPPYSNEEGTNGPHGAQGSGTTHDNTFKGNQLALRDALMRQGATSEEIKLALGIQAVESNDGITHDSSKDGRTDGGRNFSPLNLNEDMLKRNGVTGDFASLNQPRSPQDWDNVAAAFLQSKRGEGADFINRLRNGYGGHTSYTADYEQGLNAQINTQQQQGLGVRANVHVRHVAH